MNLKILIANDDQATKQGVFSWVYPTTAMSNVSYFLVQQQNCIFQLLSWLAIAS